MQKAKGAKKEFSCMNIDGVRCVKRSILCKFVKIKIVCNWKKVMCIMMGSKIPHKLRKYFLTLYITWEKDI